ncbi:nitroreductase family protein [Culicoidibacter larvae]|uniref:Nitroreductase family protein n=1 Tax=Culicoidibacter larvae TaxID=2579976 RepID=A0A5R8QBL7_9FIRM|nr:nitroreductase family protein [Culicoidibacter larvae]TLG72502.1 nitroreductase family protein [Culicoidibacter larvae]
MSIETKTLKEAIRERRSIHSLTKKAGVDQAYLDKIIETVRYAPSAFNMQSTRMVVLLNEKHEQFWDMVTKTLEAVTPAEHFPSTLEKMQGFKGGNGTILFFEDQAVVEGYMEQAPLYASNFPGWSLQGDAIMQYAMWLSLTSEGFGVSIQHYNPLIDNQVQEMYGVPGNWTLIAQMPFGEPNNTPGEKTFLPLDDVVTFVQ